MKYFERKLEPVPLESMNSHFYEQISGLRQLI